MSKVALEALPGASYKSPEKEKGEVEGRGDTESQLSSSTVSRFERGGERRLKDEDIKEKIKSFEERKVELQENLRQSKEGTDEY